MGHAVNTQTRPTLNRATMTTPALAPGACRTRRRGTSRWTCQRGLSLVEVTIMLAILVILGGTLVPVMGDSINSARFVAARNDLSQVAVALANFQRDVGPLVVDGTRLRQIQSSASSVQPVLVITSEGEPPLVADRVPIETANVLLVPPGLSLDAASIEPWISSLATDLLDLHLRVNGHHYPESASGPGTGWNGPYLSKGIAGDPWGRQYFVNTAFLRGLPPSATRCNRCAVFAISAGPNGLIETPFQQPVTHAQVFGDDLAVRIQ
jgi:type II secretory pathway pseudopilin PulG